MKTSIVIPNFNGGDLLKSNLPYVLDSEPDEVIIVDDGSTDDSLSVLKSFSDLNIVVHQKNLGFVEAVNDGFVRAKGDIVVLLNSDVVPDKNFIKPLLNHFNNPEVFAVSCNESGFSWSWGKFENGFIKHGMGQKSEKTHETFWASGGSAVFSREKWHKLGGMDKIYRPFYWEDIDICYRAQKHGWKIFWEPASKVSHQHESTISKYFDRKYIDFISARNQLIFIWKNITENKMFSNHRNFLFKSLLSDRFWWRPFIATSIKIPEILKRRKEERKNTIINDLEIFAKFKNV